MTVASLLQLALPSLARGQATSPESVVRRPAVGPSLQVSPRFVGIANGKPIHNKEPRRHEREFLEQRTFGGKTIPPDAYDRALQQWQRLPKAVSRIQRWPTAAPTSTLGVTSLKGVVWTAFGPTPLASGTSFENGRVNAIAVNPNNANLVYAGAAGGGLWVSTDALNTNGAHWVPLYDQQASLGVGEPTSIAIDPSNPQTLYVGTSREGGQVLNISKGILKSTDGGGSWVVLGFDCRLFCFNGAYDLFANNVNPFNNADINSIIVDPATSNNVYLASSQGMFFSRNAGQTWTQGTDSGGNPLTVNAQSMVLDPTATAGRILYAGANGSGIYQSANGGKTWSLVFSSATTINNAQAGAQAAVTAGNFGRIDVVLAPPTSSPNPAGIQVLYATIEGTNGATNPLGIFQSTNQGTAWSQRTANGLGQCFCFFAMVMGVDPASPGDGVNDTLYWGGQGGLGTYVKSTDSGNNFSNITNGAHADAHTIVFGRSGGKTIVFTGNDGGIWRSDDGGNTWTGTGGSTQTINGGGFQTTLIYHMDIKNDLTGSVTLGALQDNGIAQSAAIPQWNNTSCGDGIDVIFDKVTTNQVYATFECSTGPEDIYKSTSNGDNGTFTAIGQAGGIPTSELGGFSNRLSVDPNNAGFLYVSGSASQLFQTQNASTFKSIATFASNPGPVDVASANSSNVVVGVGAGVWVSTNALAATPTFANITNNLPGRTVSKVAFDPNDPTVIYATVSGFNSQTVGKPGHVFRTTLGTSSWTDLSPTVTSTAGFSEQVDLPFNALALDGGSIPTTIYAGTDLGVVRSVDGGTSWTVLDDIHLPNVPVTELRINRQAGLLRASTFGRGVFDFSPPSGPVIAVNVQNGLDFGAVCPNSSATLTIHVFNVGTQDLVINSVSNLFDTKDFSVLPNPSTPVTISPNAEVDFTVLFAPTATVGGESATFRISSNDPGAPSVDLPATGSAVGQRIGTLIADSGNFGNVCVGSFADLPLTITNSGACSLSVKNVSTPLGSDFLVPHAPGFPVSVSGGNSLDVPIRFQPSNFGSQTGKVAVSSNDPFHPTVNVGVSGNAPPPGIKVTGDASFGSVCAGSGAEKTINVCDFPTTGACSLNVLNAALNAGCADFTLVNNPFPATVSANSCLNLTVKFTPTSVGSKSCSLTIMSNDPSLGTVTVPVTANTPASSINIPPDLGFPATVVKTAGSCRTPEPFPVSNTGTCNLNINNMVLSGTNGSDYSFSGLPSLPTPLEPGHILGEGNMNTVFAPLALGRNRDGLLTVTYESDPITHATTSVTRNVCGEGVKTGARLLVTAGGVPLASVKKIHLVRLTTGKTVDLVQNALLQSVTPTIAACSPFMFHREWGTVSNPIQLVTGSYRLAVTVLIGGKTLSQTVSFNVNTCDFNPNIVVDF